MVRAQHIAAIQLIFCLNSIAQITGKWTSIDDNTGEPRSVIEVTERTGRFFGKVVRIYSKPGEDLDPVCDKCDDNDPRFKQKVIGMEILKELIKNGDEFTNGHILDPENGRVYRCKVWIEGNILKVRGYWGPFFRTQTWKHETVRP